MVEGLPVRGKPTTWRVPWRPEPGMGPGLCPLQLGDTQEAGPAQGHVGDAPWGVSEGPRCNGPRANVSPGPRAVPHMYPTLWECSRFSSLPKDVCKEPSRSSGKASWNQLSFS